MDSQQSSPRNSPQRAKSATNQSVAVVIQKTHGFFSTLKHRWSRSRSKDRGRKSLTQDGDINEYNSQSDYAADNSSEQSSSATPQTQSPRHRATTIGDSPLTRSDYPQQRNGSPSRILSRSEGEMSITGQNVIDLLQGEEAIRKREASLRQHAFFQLRIHLISGHDLVAMDKSGEFLFILLLKKK